MSAGVIQHQELTHQIQILTCVTLGKSLHLSEPQFLCLRDVHLPFPIPVAVARADEIGSGHPFTKQASCLGL